MMSFIAILSMDILAVDEQIEITRLHTSAVEKQKRQKAAIEAKWFGQDSDFSNIHWCRNASIRIPITFQTRP